MQFDNSASFKNFSIIDNNNEFNYLSFNSISQSHLKRRDNCSKIAYYPPSLILL